MIWGSELDKLGDASMNFVGNSKMRCFLIDYLANSLLSVEIISW